MAGKVISGVSTTGQLQPVMAGNHQCLAINKQKKAQNQPQAQGVGYFPRSNQNIGVILSTSLIYVNKGMIEFMRETGERFKILSRLCFSIACYFPE